MLGFIPKAPFQRSHWLTKGDSFTIKSLTSQVVNTLPFISIDLSRSQELTANAGAMPFEGPGRCGAHVSEFRRLAARTPALCPTIELNLSARVRQHPPRQGPAQILAASSQRDARFARRGLAATSASCRLPPGNTLPGLRRPARAPALALENPKTWARRAPSSRPAREVNCWLCRRHAP